MSHLLSLSIVFLCFSPLLQQCCGCKSVRITVVSVVAHGGVRWWRDQANTTWSAAVLLQVEGQREKPEAFWPSWCSWVQSGKAEIDCITVDAFWLNIFNTNKLIFFVSPLFSTLWFCFRWSSLWKQCSVASLCPSCWWSRISLPSPFIGAWHKRKGGGVFFLVSASCNMLHKQ